AERPLVVDLLDVGSLVGEQRGDASQGAGRVSYVDDETREPSGAGEAALDDRRQQQGIDVAARQHETDAAAGEPARMREHRGEPRGTGAFDDGLLDLEQ